MKRVTGVVLGLAIGDSLGATSEFEIPWEVGQNCVQKYPGWPGKLVGGGKLNWKLGQPTDDSDMAMAIVRAIKSNQGKFSADSVARNFLIWLNSGPKDVGNTTRRSLCQYSQDKSNPFKGGEWDFERHPNNQSSANGSLMRNGVIAALFPKLDQEIEALDATVLQSIITHYSPIPVLTCVIQTLLIRNALLNENEIKRPPTFEDIKNLLEVSWKNWKEKTENVEAKKWLNNVGKKLIKNSEEQILKEIKGFEEFSPYEIDYRGISGYSVLTLSIALWSLYWSFQEKPLNSIPVWLPEWPFNRHGFDTIMWVVLIGADADTYAATAGPLLAAYHPNINPMFLDGLKLKPLIYSNFNE